MHSCSWNARFESAIYTLKDLFVFSKKNAKLHFQIVSKRIKVLFRT